VDEPFCLRPWEIGRLNRWWVYNVYFRARDEKGKHIVTPKGRVDEEVAADCTRSVFYEYYEQRGVPKWYIDGLWAECKKG